MGGSGSKDMQLVDKRSDTSFYIDFSKVSTLGDLKIQIKEKTGVNIEHITLEHEKKVLDYPDSATLEDCNLGEKGLTVNYEFNHYNIYTDIQNDDGSWEENILW
jgi:hypothetical protein